MKRFALVATACALLAGSVVAAPPADARPPLPPCAWRNAPAGAPIIWVVGDSISRDYAPCLSELNPEWRVVDHALGGETSASAVNRMRALLTRTAEADLPDVAVLSWGVNDVNLREVKDPPAPRPPGYTTGEIVANIVAVRDLFVAKGVEVVVATPFTFKVVPVPPDDPLYPRGKRVWDGLMDVKKSLKKYGSAAPELRLRPIAHMQVPTAVMQGDFFRDPLHPSPRGARYIARKVSAKVKVALR